MRARAIGLEQRAVLRRHPRLPAPRRSHRRRAGAARAGARGEADPRARRRPGRAAGEGAHRRRRRSRGSRSSWSSAPPGGRATSRCTTSTPPVRAEALAGQLVARLVDSRVLVGRGRRGRRRPRRPGHGGRGRVAAAKAGVNELHDLVDQIPEPVVTGVGSGSRRCAVGLRHRRDQPGVDHRAGARHRPARRRVGQPRRHQRGSRVRLEGRRARRACSTSSRACCRCWRFDLPVRRGGRPRRRHRGGARPHHLAVPARQGRQGRGHLARRDPRRAADLGARGRAWCSASRSRSPAASASRRSRARSPSCPARWSGATAHRTSSSPRSSRSSSSYATAPTSPRPSRVRPDRCPQAGWSPVVHSSVRLRVRDGGRRSLTSPGAASSPSPCRRRRRAGTAAGTRVGADRSRAVEDDDAPHAARVSDRHRRTAGAAAAGRGRARRGGADRVAGGARRVGAGACAGRAGRGHAAAADVVVGTVVGLAVAERRRRARGARGRRRTPAGARAARRRDPVSPTRSRPPAG